MFLLQGYWALLPFINKALSAILTIDRFLIKGNILENFEMMKISYTMLLLSFSPKTTLEYLYDYFILISISLVENLQKYKNLLMGCPILFKNFFSCNKT